MIDQDLQDSILTAHTPNTHGHNQVSTALAAVVEGIAVLRKHGHQVQLTSRAGLAVLRYPMRMWCALKPDRIVENSEEEAAAAAEGFTGPA